MLSSDKIEDYIRTVQDFPEPGIAFKDISPLLDNPKAFQQVIDELAEKSAPYGCDKVMAIDARGFIFGTALAQKLGVGLGMIRKAGKLPYTTVTTSYDLEYGRSTVEMHVDAVEQGQNILLVDDVLATGGTAAAAIRLIEECNAKVTALAVLVELKELEGQQYFKHIPVITNVSC
ncbi:MAG: adenine phosphoribosyltransferase [Lentisphaeria bacterium]|nr:adenine phosphoribosyltransferase [Lentisphaeria bacterium]